jgi:hypothetical protein
LAGVASGSAEAAAVATQTSALSCSLNDATGGQYSTTAVTLTVTPTVPTRVAPGRTVTYTDVEISGWIAKQYSSEIDDHYQVITVKGGVTGVTFSTTTARTTPSTLNALKTPMPVSPITFDPDGNTLTLPTIKAANPWTADTTGIVFATLEHITP